MKELTIEEKAKLYDEAKDRMSRAFNDNRCSIDFRNEIFPELAESKDEKIRKELIDYFKENNAALAFKGISNECVIAWLEEQGQHKKFRDSIQIGDKVTRNEDGVLVNLSQLKRVAKTEQKLIDKIEPKFKVGDVVENVFTHDQRRVTSIKDDSYITDNVGFIGFYDQDDWELVEQKPAWSEEDEKEVAILEAYIRGKDWSDRHIDRALGIVDELVNKVKSLKDRYTWKPSDEQMKALDNARHSNPFNVHVLDTLFHDLKTK